ncbi:MAG: glycosyltransferase family 2 protein [Microscillaceae bacterium]|nr:glycosyltransferase family 2 protein [Microscillaceae bacterium]MDW8459925.1 glycosyltransferase family 2 protein [Cytophagales bacterium]
MKVSGFTFIRNALKYDYPIVEAIQSILPLCDEVVVCVGNSEDETLQLIQNIPSPKIRIIQSIWDDNLRQNGEVLALETNKAFDAISPDSDWAFYIQGDEVIHEQYYDNIQKAMLQYKDQPQVEGLLFHYKHFYATYDYIADSRQWYRREVRIIRNDKRIRSYKDAQGFRKNNQKLKVKLIDAYVFHYGWVKNPALQKEKEKNFHRYWHSDEWISQHVKPEDFYDYSNIDSLQIFQGSHPAVMQARIKAKNWHFEFDTNQKKLSLKNRILQWIEQRTGIRLFEYRNYKLI